MPTDRILVEADLFTPPVPNGPGLVPVARGFGNNRYAKLQRLKLPGRVADVGAGWRIEGSRVVLGTDKAGPTVGG